MNKSHTAKVLKNDEFGTSTVVYVTDQYACEALIAQGRKIADQTETNLYVVNVSNGSSPEHPIDLNALEYLYQISRKHQAVMNVFYETDILGILKKTADDYNAEHVVIGAPRQMTSVLTDFLSSKSECTFHMVYPNGNSGEVDATTCMPAKREKATAQQEARYI